MNLWRSHELLSRSHCLWEQVFPPLLIQASTSEMLYDDSRLFVECAKAAGVDATLEVWDDMMHVFQAFGLPESKEAINNISKFVQRLFI